MTDCGGVDKDSERETIINMDLLNLRNLMYIMSQPLQKCTYVNFLT